MVYGVYNPFGQNPVYYKSCSITPHFNVLGLIQHEMSVSQQQSITLNSIRSVVEIQL